MKLRETKRLRGIPTGAVGGWEETPEQRDARKLAGQRRIRIAMSAHIEEIARSEIVLRPFNVAEHKPSGRLFKLVRGEVDAMFSPAVAFYMTASGEDVVFLEAMQGGRP